MNEFLSFWSHIPEHINPFLDLGFFKIRYYGLAYIAAFSTCYWMVLLRIRREERFSVTRDQVADISVYMMLGVIVGARLGYVLFYNFQYYAGHPLEIFLPFKFSGGFAFTGISGMSYHGGLIGSIVAARLYIRKNKLHFRDMTDLFTPAIPLGYTFGRLGNFVNGELYGRITASPIGMYFPLAPGPAARHPSQLYEAFFEGVFLFAVLWIIRKYKTAPGGMLALYLIGYGAVRFVIEFFREPDAHIGFVFHSFSRGQVLCGLMILAGVLLYWRLWRMESSES